VNGGAIFEGYNQPVPFCGTHHQLVPYKIELFYKYY
jgi:hypothetical protein